VRTRDVPSQLIRRTAASPLPRPLQSPSIRLHPARSRLNRPSLAINKFRTLSAIGRAFASRHSFSMRSTTIVPGRPADSKLAPGSQSNQIGCGDEAAAGGLADVPHCNAFMLIGLCPIVVRRRCALESQLRRAERAVPGPGPSPARSCRTSSDALRPVQLQCVSNLARTIRLHLLIVTARKNTANVRDLSAETGLSVNISSQITSARRSTVLGSWLPSSEMITLEQQAEAR
jgi:hypothetical protein